MGNCFDAQPVSSNKPVAGKVPPGLSSFKAKAIGNNFETKEQLVKAIRDAGLEQFNLLLAIDFTKSNMWQGTKTFGGRNLHDIRKPPQQSYVPVGQSYAKTLDSDPPGYDFTTSDPPPVYRQQSVGRTLTFGRGQPKISEMKDFMSSLNPYQYVMSVAGNQLNEFDDDGYIPTVIFGHARTSSDSYIKEISTNPQGCYKIDDAIAAYENAVNLHGLSGPTHFAPLIEWGMEKVRRNGNAYHILLIIGDGAIDDYDDTVRALQRASKVPLSIVFCGVGDGSDPDNIGDKWARMRKLDDAPSGDVDNWQSVYITDLQPALANSPHPDLDLVTQIMMEIPEQYLYFKNHGMIGK